MPKLLVSPLKKELHALLEGLRKEGLSIEEEQVKGRRLWRIPSKNLICVVGGHGKSQFGVQTQFWISQLTDIEHVICVGSGGSLSPAIKPLDLVLGTQIQEHDYKQSFSSSGSFPTYHCHEGFLEQAKNLRSKNFEVHLGIIASGDEDITSPSRAEALRQQTQALAVAWEGAGGARAARFNDLPYSEIRAVTDNAKDNVPEEFMKNLSNAMAHAAEFLTQLLP